MLDKTRLCAIITRMSPRKSRFAVLDTSFADPSVGLLGVAYSTHAGIHNAERVLGELTRKNPEGGRLLAVVEIPAGLPTGTEIYEYHVHALTKH
jgi:hypothetical protein